MQIRSTALRLLAGSILLAGLTLAAHPASAATFTYSYTVNTLADTPSSHDTTPGDGICLDASGKCSLRAATEEANADPNYSYVTITVPSGTIHLTQGSLLLEDNDITVIGVKNWPLDTTVIDGSGNIGSVPVFLLTSSGARGTTFPNIKLSYLTITGGSGGEGGGIYSGTANTIMDHDVVIKNGGLHTALGGGVFSLFGTLTIATSRITNNHADAPTQPDAAAPSNAGFVLVFLETEPCSTIAESFGAVAETGSGGGVFVYNSAVIQSTLIDHNTASCAGGGIYTYQNLQLKASDLSNNIAGGTTAQNALANNTVPFAPVGYGGGLFTDNITQVTDGNFVHNTAGYAGGGIFNNDRYIELSEGPSQTTSGDLIMTGPAIQNNLAGEFGGGIANGVNGPNKDLGSDYAMNNLTNVAIVRNKVGNAVLHLPGVGGGIYNRGYDNLHNVSIVSNQTIPVGPPPSMFTGTAPATRPFVAPATSPPIKGGTLNPCIINRIAISRKVNEGPYYSGCGGGIYDDLYSSELLEGGHVGNNAALFGGGIFTIAYDTELNRNPVNLNYAYVGGGIFIADTANPVLIQNTSVGGNTGRFLAGGIWNLFDGAFFLSDSFLAGNHAPNCPNSQIPCA